MIALLLAIAVFGWCLLVAIEFDKVKEIKSQCANSEREAAVTGLIVLSVYYLGYVSHYCNLLQELPQIFLYRSCGYEDPRIETTPDACPMTSRLL
jgi:hypothetical protein